MPLSLRSWSPRLIRRQGVVNFISGLGDTVGQRLASHRGIGMVSLTGSVETGSKVTDRRRGERDEGESRATAAKRPPSC